MSTTTTSGVDGMPPEVVSDEPSREHNILRISPASSGESVMESKLADEAQLRKFTEDVLDSRQQEIESRENEKNQLAIQSTLLKKELIDTQWQLAEARNLNKSKTKLLQEAQDQVFRLQPRRKDITEAEAQQAYRGLCSNVERWVNHRLNTLLDIDPLQLAARPISTQATRLVGLFRSPAKRCLDTGETDEYHVMSAIMNYLYLFIFSKSFFCPLDDNPGDRTLKWLNEVETAMSRLPRDLAHCREWRSETLTALASQPSFKARRTRHIQVIAENLASLLAFLIPDVSSLELGKSIRRSIIEPAADLAHQMHVAPNILSLKWPARNAASRLENYECINVANGVLLLELGKTTLTSPVRQKTSYLFDVFPGLFVERFEQGKKLGPKAIVKPTVLVHSGDEGASRKPTLMKCLWDLAGGPRPPSVSPTKKDCVGTRLRGRGSSFDVSGNHSA